MDIRLAAAIYFAVGCDVPVDDIAQISGVSDTTILRYLNSGWLNDPRCERLQQLGRKRRRQNTDVA